MNKSKNTFTQLTADEMKQITGGLIPMRTRWLCQTLYGPGYACYNNQPYLFCGLESPCVDAGYCYSLTEYCPPV